MLRIRGLLKTQSNMYDVQFSIETLCNTGIFRTQDIFRTPPDIYYGEFYSEPCVTLAYLESKAYSQHCQTSIMKYVYSKPCVTLACSEP